MATSQSLYTDGVKSQHSKEVALCRREVDPDATASPLVQFLRGLGNITAQTGDHFQQCCRVIDGVESAQGSFAIVGEKADGVVVFPVIEIQQHSHGKG